ncbi:GFA family protein [Pyruvatibacter sp.]|uniref:GFA family protein n=1 Tax=Pyruvatibacter sp. TaxID=1981328 RepID=UPI0032F01A0C
MKEARCQCGRVTATVTGEPVGVVVCHCLDCQRRSGSVFGIGAYYPAQNVQISGPTTHFTRPTDIGNTFHEDFCPVCGTTLYWSSDKNPGMIGIAVGAFGDPHFAAPARSVWEQSCHDWLALPTNIEHFEKGRA